jgi:hypothetical protein
MGALYVYEPWPDAVDTLGLCGPLTPTKAVCVQERNGDFRLDIEHPIDDKGKWATLEPGNMIRANVPMRTVPLVQQASYAAYMSAPTRYIVKSGLSSADRSVMSGRIGGNPNPVRLAILNAGETVYITETPMSSEWSGIAWKGGRGWMLNSALESAGTVTLGNTRAGTEVALPSPKSRPQLFRIYSISLSEDGVRAVARHVSYDIAGSLVSLSLEGMGGELNVIGPMLNIVEGYALGAITDHVRAMWYVKDKSYPLSNSDSFGGWSRVGKIEALLGASNSVVACWKFAVLRDNWVYSAISDPEYASGYVIEYAKNLRGITCEVNTSDIQSALLPVGQTSKGKPLIIPDGTYTVDGVATTVTNGIISSANDNYPTPHIAAYDLGSAVKATGTTSGPLTAAYQKMIRAVRTKFADEQCDLPSITLNVDFLHLGDTAEYAQYRDLQKLFLYDTVRVKHPRLGIDVTTQVNKTEWDCILDRYNSIELGSVRRNYARSRVAPWQVPGLASLQSYVDTISGLI